MNIVHWDLDRLDEWAAKQEITCPTCGERFTGADGEEAIRHMLGHERRTKQRRMLKRMLSVLRNWERLPEAVRQQYNADCVRRDWSDPARFEQLLAEGVVTKYHVEEPE